MSEGQHIWLVVNDASGSNRAAAREELLRSLRAAGFDVARTIRFPDETLPDCGGARRSRDRDWSRSSPATARSMR